MSMQATRGPHPDKCCCRETFSSQNSSRLSFNLFSYATLKTKAKGQKENSVEMEWPVRKSYGRGPSGVRTFRAGGNGGDPEAERGCERSG